MPTLKLRASLNAGQISSHFKTFVHKNLSRLNLNIINVMYYFCSGKGYNYYKVLSIVTSITPVQNYYSMH